VAKYLNKKQRNQLLENQIARNRENMIETLRKARRRVEMRMIEAARNERFATVRRIRDGIYKDIGEEYKRLQGDLDEWTQDSILRTSKVYHGIAAADLLATDEDKLASSFTKFSAKHNEQYFAKVHPFNAEKLAAVNVHLNPQLVRMAETDVRALRAATVDALREAHIAGMTPQERYRLLRGKVMDLAENPKSWQFIDRSGRKWKKNNYFDMLNRTVTANVARDTYHDALADEQRDLVQIIGGTSADSNEACVKFDGKIVSMTGATSGFPTLDEYISEGGFHPNCVHSTAYVSRSFGPHRKLIEEQETPQEYTGTDGRKVESASGVSYMQDKQDARSSDWVMIEADTNKLNAAWKKSKSNYLAPSDQGIRSVGLDAHGDILLDKHGKEVEKSRKEWFRDWRKQHPRTPIEAPNLGFTRGTIGESVTINNGRHRMSVLREEGRASVMVSVPRADSAGLKSVIGVQP